MEQVESEIATIRSLVAVEAKSFLDAKTEEAAEVSPDLGEFVALAGRHALLGKMMREVLMVLGYRAVAREPDENAIIRAAASLTMLQAYLLIHDDIMDCAETRRGGPSAWAEIRDMHRRRFRSGHRRFGESAAIILGDLFESWAVEILATSRFSDDLKARAMQAYADAVGKTGYGQYIDMLTGELTRVDEATIEKIHRFKTAVYTVDLPFRLGLIFGGAEERMLASLAGFTIPLGIAFQMTDDIIDLFGDPGRLGKPIGGDIREGKKTIMVIYALEHAEMSDRRALRRALGRDSLTPEDIAYVRGIMKRSGALEYARQKVRLYYEEAMEALERIGLPEEGTSTLQRIAGRLVEREY